MKRRSFFGMIAGAVFGGVAKPERTFHTGGVVRGPVFTTDTMEAVLPLHRHTIVPPDVERARFWRAYFREQRRIAKGEPTGLMKAIGQQLHEGGEAARSVLECQGHRIGEVRINGVPVPADEIEDTRGHA